MSSRTPSRVRGHPSITHSQGTSDSVSPARETGSRVDLPRARVPAAVYPSTDGWTSTRRPAWAQCSGVTAPPHREARLRRSLRYIEWNARRCSV
eukprot:4243759-Pyramimonas_sp.AAC.1